MRASGRRIKSLLLSGLATLAGLLRSRCTPEILGHTANVWTALPARIEVVERGMVLAPMNGLSFMYRLFADLAMLFWFFLRPRRTLATENLFLRKQPARYQERGVKPRRPDAETRISLLVVSRCFDWRNALVNVSPQTFVRCYRQGSRLISRWKPRPERPASDLPAPVRLGRDGARLTQHEYD